MAFGLIHATNEKVETQDIIWKGKVNPDDSEIYTFKGSFEQINEEILAINPNYYDHAERGLKKEEEGDSGPKTKTLEKRDSITCNVAGDKATLKDIRTVIGRLKANKGQCTAPSGPGVCSRLSCAYGSYVTFCNDNNSPLTRNCAEFGDMAQRIVDSCTPRNSAVLIGQYFNSQFKFNALVKGGGPC